MSPRECAFVLHSVIGERETKCGKVEGKGEQFPFCELKDEKRKKDRRNSMALRRYKIYNEVGSRHLEH